LGVNLFWFKFLKILRDFADMGGRSGKYSKGIYLQFFYWPANHFFRSNRISNRIGRPIRCRIKSSNRIFNPSVFCICDKREWCTDYGTPNWVLVYFNSVI